MAVIGIDKINMYVGLVNDEFGPLLRAIQADEAELKEHLTREARLDLGIYDLHKEKIEISLRLAEIEDQLKEYEKPQFITGIVGRTCKLDMLVKDKMDAHSNGANKKIKDAHKEMVKRIKLSGISEDIAKVFKDLPKEIKKLETTLKKRKQIGHDAGPGNAGS